MASDVVISVDNVSKRFRLYRERPQNLKNRIIHRQKSRYDVFWALRDVSMDVTSGTTYGIIGPNGSGKSTLLRLIAGIHRPTKGKVSTKGRVAALLELGAGFHPELTGRENIYLNGSILGFTRRDISRILDDIVDFSGLKEFIDTAVKLYSSGMYVRLGFSVAVHLDPEILLIDEIIAVGDEEFQRRCRDHIYKLRRDGVTMVIVSHSLGVTETLCDRVAWLDHGAKLAEGDARVVVQKYLDSVNIAERERLDGESGAVAGDDVEPTRRGTREIEILGLEFLDGAGRAVQVGRSGEPLTIRIRYHASTPVALPVFGLGIHHESGAHLSGPNTQAGDVTIASVEGSGWVDYRLDRLVLLPGKYLVSVSVYDEHILHAFDYRDRAFVLQVQPGQSPERYGMIELAGHWHVAPAREGKELVG
jgi:ABC-type polysaccharide/polyol phosphate transport system ATPase subunit